MVAYGHVGDGNIHYNVLPPGHLAEDELQAYLQRCEDSIFQVVDRLGGSLSAEHGIGICKRSAFLERISPLHLGMIREIKAAFDPRNSLSPGRILT